MNILANFDLLLPPKDYITSLVFTESNSLVVSSISGEIHIFSKPGSCDASPTIINSNSHMPIVSSCKYLNTVYFAHPNSISSISIDDNNLLNTTTILEGFDLLQSIVLNSYYKYLIVASAAGSIYFYDILSLKLINQINLDFKIQAMDTLNNYLIVSLSNSTNQLFELKNDDKLVPIPIITQESGFKYPVTTSIKILPWSNPLTYVQSSMEGKVSVISSDNKNRFTFKCHRVVLQDNVEFVGPINDLCCYQDEYFLTAGSNVDRSICCWNYKSKKRVKQLKNFPMAISRLGYNSDLKLVIVCMSDDSFKNMPTPSENEDLHTSVDQPSIITVLQLA